MLRRRALLALVATAFLLAPLSALAQEEVKVTVHVIHASKKKGKVDERLAQLEKELTDFGFKSYILLRAQEMKLPLATSGQVELPGDRRLVVTPLSRDEDGKLKLQVVIEGVVDTTINIKDGASILFGGLKHEGGRLMVAITQSAI
ncbi:MAG: hypothetical protein P1V51_24035 [Deltaproteobacteria bacterium]|nr:hypothetical protein [Deltaproteobacteria bacterium]